jgi:serine/threonine protein kinase
VGQPTPNVRVVGRYALYDAIAAGGMATVHLGRLLGPVGFSRTVAIKRLHAQFASDPEFVSMFLDEARLAARIRHPNVVPTLDVVATSGELFLVMEYVPGESVGRLARAMREHEQTVPLRITSTIVAGLLHGLHAAHEAKDERGYPLGIVHRDVSPQNVLVGTDGVPRVLDFGVAKAAGRMQTTKEGQIKGKLSYMPPEQLNGGTVSRQTDIYAAGVVLWELLTGRRLFAADNEGAVVAKVLEGRFLPPSQVLASGKRTITNSMQRQLEAVDALVMRALAKDPQARFATAREMAVGLERALQPATASDVGDWVEHVARDVLHSRAALVAEIESSASALSHDANHVMSVLQTHDTLQARRDEPTRVAGGGGSMRPSYVATAEGPPVTQPSSISVSSAHHEDTGRKTAAAVAAGALIGLVLVGTAVAWKYVPALHHARSAATSASVAHDPNTSASATATASATAAATTVATAASATLAEPNVAEDAGPAEATATSSATAPAESASAVASAAKGPRPVHHASTTTKPAPSSSEAPAPDCTTPYWFDADGVKHYKPECVK